MAVLVAPPSQSSTRRWMTGDTGGPKVEVGRLALTKSMPMVDDDEIPNQRQMGLGIQGNETKQWTTRSIPRWCWNSQAHTNPGT